MHVDLNLHLRCFGDLPPFHDWEVVQSSGSSLDLFLGLFAFGLPLLKYGGVRSGSSFCFAFGSMHSAFGSMLLAQCIWNPPNAF